MKELVAAFWLCMFLISCNEGTIEKGTAEHIRQVTESISASQLLATDKLPGNWITHGLNYQENRFSELNQIRHDNLRELGLVWSLDLATKRGIEATPIVVDGILYFTGPWSIVYAVHARTGQLIWIHNPEVPPDVGERGCCDVVNRGVAIYEGKIYVGTFDGRLLALDAATGDPIWSVLTVDTTKPYTITGAPRVVSDKVIIGNGGAEYGVRGYITAYDVNNGDQVWRFYTVPGDPNLPFESEAMEKAAKTWTGEWWKYGGGGTAWDAMAYDAEANLLYVGTGNGSPWNRQYRSPGGGDNLYISSILALNPDSGKLVWHFQTTPGDTWDFTATQHIILADLMIDGQMRKVLMQAPKNGYFYVIDRITGAFISANNFVYMNWSTGVDPITGRPIESDFARFENVNADISPNYDGGHNWHPMAFNPNTGLVYIPAREVTASYGTDPWWKYNEQGFGAGNGWNLGTGFNEGKPYVRDTFATGHLNQGRLIAWDPIQGKAAWTIKQRAAWNGGILTTAANLVFQGTGDGRFVIYDGITGEELWEADLGGGILAPPVTYLVDDLQYISIAVGWGGGFGQKKKYRPLQPGRMFTFALGGKASYPTYAKETPKELPAIDQSASKDEIAKGGALFKRYCSICHVAKESGGGIIPNLAYLSQGSHDKFLEIVRDGALSTLGMPNFSTRLSEVEALDIQKYLIHTSNSIRLSKEMG